MPKLVQPNRIIRKQGSKRYPAIVMYPEDVHAKAVNENHWRPRMGHKYAYSDLIRQLMRAEALFIERHGKSILDMEFPETK